MRPIGTILKEKYKELKSIKVIFKKIYFFLFFFFYKKRVKHKLRKKTNFIKAKTKIDQSVNTAAMSACFVKRDDINWGSLGEIVKIQGQTFFFFLLFESESSIRR